MSHVIKHDFRVKGLPFSLYCNGKLVASAQIAYQLGNCPICNAKVSLNEIVKL